MEELKEISKILTRFKNKRPDFLQRYPESVPDNYVMVVDAIVSGKVSSDDDAAEMIGANKSSGKYWMFKSRLKNKLLNSMLFVDLDEKSVTPYTRAKSICGRNRYCIYLLVQFTATNAGIALAEKTLAIAKEFELFDTAIFCCRMLRKQYTYRGNIEKFLFYDEKIELYYKMALAEDKATGYFDSLNVIQVNRNNYKAELKDKALEYTKKIEVLYKKYPTYQVGLQYLRTKANYHYICKDYYSALENWKEYEKLLERYKTFEYNTRLAELTLQLLYCYLGTGNYSAGVNVISKCEELFKTHTNNWFIYKESFFLLAMHTRNYKEAGDTVRMITNASHFKSLNRNRQEKWKIFEAYHYTILKAHPGLNENPEGYTFRMSRFLNEIPLYNKDKQGYNTSILFIQIMNLLIDNDFTKLADRMEALKRYANRYFDKDAINKSHIFMKMLIIADKCGYQAVPTLKKTQKLYLRLQTPGYTHVSSYDGLEIVPYAHLWEIVVRCLEG